MTTGSTNRRDGALDPRRRKLLFGLLFVAAGQAAMARGDLWVKEKILGRDGKPLGERVWTMGAGKIRMDQGAAGFVIDTASGGGWIYGPEEGRCVALPAITVPSTRAQGRIDASDVESFQRSVVGVAGVAQVVLRDESKTIAGFAAKRHEVVRDGTAIEERWFAIDLPDDDYDAFALGLSTATEAAAIQALSFAAIAIQSHGRGFSLRSKNLRSGVVFEAVEVRQAPQPDSAFTPPPACAGR